MASGQHVAQWFARAPLDGPINVGSVHLIFNADGRPSGESVCAPHLYLYRHRRPRPAPSPASISRLLNCETFLQRSLLCNS